MITPLMSAALWALAGVVAIGVVDLVWNRIERAARRRRSDTQLHSAE